MNPRATLTAAACLAAVTLVWSGCTNAGTVVPLPEPTDPSELDPPPMGAGVQMKTDAFTVPAATEMQACYFYRVSDLAAAAGLDPTQPLDVHRVQIVQKAGSHHMNLFRVRTIKGLDPAKGTQVGVNGQGPCFVSSNWSDWPLIANMQQSGADDWSYPDGVANELAPCEVVMLQTHFVNAATQGTPDGVGQVGVNLWTMDPSAVTAQLGSAFATDQNIRICKDNPTPLFGIGFPLNNATPVTIIGANGHFHSRGKEFDIFPWDGKTAVPDLSTRFYRSLSWNEPLMVHTPDMGAVEVPAHGGFYYQCSYQWQDPALETQNAITCANLDAYDASKPPPPPAMVPPPDCCYRFGPQVDLNEHCNAFVYYYPAPPLDPTAPGVCH
jgi:hypothetical protein